ncbi:MULTISPECIES: Asp-tRNA(Asn)/Glu-tRNA(Gln) amidotransferase subunit GatC [Jonquetella]|uniref:Aspartyl/glutamyl-tRNA(Asn/Gln) amidotransferase subunit C n=1 Tax=Jonquetella anthropi DSM 22815 TaxID=885272 RepID=H0UKH0_9BACT|nr:MULTISPECIES: Asp-tRNA(Asn)/Glu-tRNA(Gln) amidotransferase subunit GatC [Jonquetella]EEX48370.1 aspartyl/glutamyl-tRNA(Asn/Gln) amidotransferase, C subunit [Jonquetella anthropi E3_33 E1]EHM13179.1 glutamyl-tRNA(Gln) and/or aspartyl-tRNA(Asn) amidotransferase, C subunit [Jonquetella anthropi DSM 22815]ERL23655.1 aspartyl/glutamyl-tRNA(Asn/Gln) amidotransferase, C subunit [Jonquetella sp. BV3C21]
MTGLTKEEILKIGKLARLEIDPSELDALEKHFGSVLSYFEVLKELDVSSVDLADKEGAESMRLEPDEIGDSGSNREAILSQAPQRDGDFFRVPKIGGDEE